MITVKYEEQLQKDGKILASPTGVSMMPILRQEKDIMLIEKPSGELKINDAVLYKREDGQYVMHRIIGIDKSGYAIRGDNCNYIEYGIKREQIIGIMMGFYRDDKYIDCEKNRSYRVYVAFVRVIYFLRYGMNFIKRGIKKIIRGLRRDAKDTR